MRATRPINRSRSRSLVAVAFAVSMATLAHAQSPEPEPSSDEIDWSILGDESWVAEAGQGIWITPRQRRKPPAARFPQWNRTDGAGNTAAVSVKQSLSTNWEAALGVDLQQARAANLPLPIDSGRSAQGSAWVNMTFPGMRALLGWDKTSIDARVDPLQDQGTLATAFSRSLPINRDFAVTVQNRYSVTQTLQRPGGMLPTSMSQGSLAPMWGVDPSVTLAVRPTGTTFAAGSSRWSSDAQWHNTLSAQQTVYGPLNVTTAITDVGTRESVKTITIGYQRNW